MLDRTPLLLEGAWKPGQAREAFTRLRRQARLHGDPKMRGPEGSSRAAMGVVRSAARADQRHGGDRARRGILDYTTAPRSKGSPSQQARTARLERLKLKHKMAGED